MKSELGLGMEGTRALWTGQRGRSGKHEAAKRAVEDGPQAFADLYECYGPRIYTYMLARTQHEEDADDLTQQVFLQALDALPRYQEQGAPVAAWLFSIARNLVIDRHRRRRYMLRWDFLPELIHPATEQIVEDLVIQEESIARVRKLVQQLEPAKKETVLLRFVAGLKVREIARVLERSEAAVKTELRRTVQMLQEQYYEE